MIDLRSLSSSRFGKVMSPILTVTALGVLLVGCNQPVVPAKTDDDAMMGTSSSSAVMMDDSDSVMMEEDFDSDDAMMTSSAVMTSSAMMQSSEAAMHMYKDGSYSAGGVYRSPAGGETVTISLTVKDDTVTGATFSGDATHKKSQAMQAAFSEGFKEQVVGKSLDEVSVGVVNGSSLTGGGFMDALAKIKVEAKA